MVDAGTAAIAAIALIGSAIAVLVVWLEWTRLRATREQLALLEQLTREQGEKVERLGTLVTALRSTVETKVQKLQISALERQVEVATAALKTQEGTVEIPRTLTIPGTARSAAVLSQVSIDEEDSPTGAIGRFRAWAGWRRAPPGRDLGRSPRKGSEI